MKNLNQEFEEISNPFYQAQKEAHLKFEKLLESLNINNLSIDATYEFDKRNVWCNLVIVKINDISLNLNAYDIDDDASIQNIVSIFNKMSQKQKPEIDTIQTDDGLDEFLAAEISIAEVSFSLKRSPVEVIGFLSNLVNSDISFIPSKYLNHTS